VLCIFMLTVLCVCCVFMCTSACEHLVCIVLNVEGGGLGAWDVVVLGVCCILWCLVFWDWDVCHKMCVVLYCVCMRFWCRGCFQGGIRR